VVLYRLSAAQDKVVEFDVDWSEAFRAQRRHGLRSMLVMPRGNVVIVKRHWGTGTSIDIYFLSLSAAQTELNRVVFWRRERELDEICFTLGRLYNRLYGVRGNEDRQG